jgi:hypothetical protein
MECRSHPHIGGTSTRKKRFLALGVQRHDRLCEWSVSREISANERSLRCSPRPHLDALQDSPPREFHGAVQARQHDLDSLGRIGLQFSCSTLVLGTFIGSQNWATTVLLSTRTPELGVALCQRIFQFRFQLGEYNSLCVNIVQFVVEHLSHFGARSKVIASQGQELADFIQGKPERLQIADELQCGQMARGIQPKPAFAARGRCE